MRKSILRFGALALMSLMSISSWAQLNVGDTFEDANGNSYVVAEAYASNHPGKAQLVSIADVENNLVNLNAVAPVNPKSGEYYQVTEVATSACVRVSNNNVTVIIPNNLAVTLGIQAFANEKVTVQLQNGMLHADTEIKANAFKNATVKTTKTDKFLDFSNRALPANAFYDVKFESGTIIYMGGRELSEGVFGASTSHSDIQTVQFRLDSKITTVPAKAFMNRTGLNNFGYNDGSFLLPTDLKIIGDYAFAGTGLTQFKFSDRDEGSEIVKIGKYAFEGCKWMKDEVFKQVCKSGFKGLEFDEGSFKGCDFTSVDLDGNARTITINTNFGAGDPTYENFPGVPAYAFEGNSRLSTLKFGDAEFKAIGASAFAGTALATVELPKGIVYLDKSAFALETKQTSSTQVISLPTSLKGIKLNALKNRYIYKVYVSPDFDYTNFNVPQLENQEGLNVASMQLPTAKRNIIPHYNNGQFSYNEYQTPKTVFKAAGWKTVDDVQTIALGYAKEFENNYVPVDNFFYYVICDGVKYKIDPTPNGDYGYFNATVVAFTVSEATVHGMLQTTSVKYDAKVNNEIGSYDAKLRGGTYTYDNIVLNVTGFAVTEEESPVSAVGYPEDKQNVCTMTEVTFDREAKAIAPDGDVDVAQDFVGISGTNYATIPASLFVSNSPYLKSVTLAEGIVSVGASAFYGTQINAITLPKTLTTIGDKAFATSSLETVNVCYSEVPALSTAPFATVEGGTRYVALLNVTGDATRDDYRSVNVWKNFFDTNFETIKVKEDAKDATLRILASEVTKDAEGNYIDTYVLKDDVAEIKVTTTDTKLNIRYDRYFAAANWQCWYVPFDFKFTDNAEYEFAQLYDTQLEGDATVFEYKKVQPGKDVIIKANTPYVIKPADVGNCSFTATGIVATPETDPTFVVSNAENTYTFTSIYSKKAVTSKDDCNWYAINAKNPNCLFEKASYFAPEDERTSSFLNAYRFYMEIGTNSDNPYATSPNVKFVVLDEDEVTAIENVKVNSLNAPMFDLQGRQIVAPAKGQVYIQNGVKKLAR